MVGNIPTLNGRSRYGDRTFVGWQSSRADRRDGRTARLVTPNFQTLLLSPMKRSSPLLHLLEFLLKNVDKGSPAAMRCVDADILVHEWVRILYVSTKSIGESTIFIKRIHGDVWLLLVARVCTSLLIIRMSWHLRCCFADALPFPSQITCSPKHKCVPSKQRIH